MKMKITMLCLLVAGLTNGFAQVKKTAAPKGKAPVAVKKRLLPLLLIPATKVFLLKSIPIKEKLLFSWNTKKRQLQ